MPQVSEKDKDSIREVLTLFYPQSPPDAINDRLALLAAKMFYEALKAARLMDILPRPPGGKPGIAWLVTQIFVIFFRGVGSKHQIPVVVRRTVGRNFRSEYEMNKLGI
ncbi:MAG: hypothetical protein KDE62_08275 [Calditrichaeota bacterium]|nr:hypothetical protein [Calditrichota bacterium]